MDEPKIKHFIGRKTTLETGTDKCDWFDIEGVLKTNDEDLSQEEITRRISLGTIKFLQGILEDKQ